MPLTILLNAAVAGMRKGDRLHLLLPKDRQSLLVEMNDPDCGCLSAIRIDSDGLNIAVSTHHLARLGDPTTVREFEARFASMPPYAGNEADWELHDWHPF